MKKERKEYLKQRKSVSPVGSLIEKLDQSQRDLDVTIDSLGSKIKPILTPAPDVDKGEAKTEDTPKVLSDIENILHGQIIKITRAVNKIKSIRSRVVL